MEDCHWDIDTKLDMLQQELVAACEDEAHQDNAAVVVATSDVPAKLSEEEYHVSNRRKRVVLQHYQQVDTMLLYEANKDSVECEHHLHTENSTRRRDNLDTQAADTLVISEPAHCTWARESLKCLK